MNRSPLEYQGPPGEYVPYVDNPSKPRLETSGTYGKGYADIDFLLSELKDLGFKSKSLYDDAEKEMVNYTLSIDPSDETLVKSHQMSYPDDTTPNSISFKEYIYNFSESQSTSSQYVNKYYENKVRGIYGTNALDVAHVARITYSEVKRIELFLEKNIEEIDDEKELRILEAFQDWAQNAQNIIKGFRQVFTQKSTVRIPQAEMAELTERKAKEFQGLFQSKINLINVSISDLISQYYKDWDIVASIFYEKILGPSLRFNLQVSRNINSLNRTAAPLLYREASMTSNAFDKQLRTAIDDQAKRNNLYYDYAIRLLENINQRDTYVNFLDQLSNKGTTIPNKFITQFSPEPKMIQEVSSLLGEKQTITFDANASSDHNFMSGRDALDAHPQYVKKIGDLIEGNLEIIGGVRINGYQIEDLFSYNKQGNVVINASNIDWTNIEPDATAEAVNELVPDDLTLVSRRNLSDSKIEYTIDFNIGNPNVQGYEFEIIEL